MDHPDQTLWDHPIGSDDVRLVEVDDQELDQEFERLQRGLGLEPGWRNVDRFRIISQLGKGGMGIVYAAEDPKLDRMVALKLVRPRHEGSRLRLQARLSREARALGRLSHPNVVRVYDVGSDGDELFVAMELVDGPTLLDWQWQRERSLDELLHVYLQAAAGLTVAHDAGLVHRDFKPDNVFVTSDERVLVGDFGLANLDETTLTTTDSGPIQSSGLTEAGAVLGTLGYMAPEQLRGEDVDARADQFGFCVALWEAITRERPFAGIDSRAQLAAIEAGELRHAPRVPRRLRAILQKGLAFDRADRFANLRELADAIRTLDERRRWPAVLAAAALGLAAAGVLVTRAVPEPCEERERIEALWGRSRDDVDEQFRRMSASVLLARADRAIERLQTKGDAVCRAPSDDRRVVLRRAIDELGTALANPTALRLSGWVGLIVSLESFDLDQPVIAPAVAAALDRSRMHEWHGNSQLAREAADEAVELALTAAPSGWSASVSGALLQRGRLAGWLEPVDALADLVLAEAHAEGSGHGAQVLRTRLEQANILVKYGAEPERARLALTRLEPLLLRHSAPLDGDRARVHYLRSVLASRDGELGPCIGHAGLAALIHAVFRPNPVELARTYEGLGILLEPFGVTGVDSLFERSASILRSELPNTHHQRLHLDYNRARWALSSADEEQQQSSRGVLQALRDEADPSSRTLAAEVLLYDALSRDDLGAIRALVHELRPEQPMHAHVLIGAARLGELDIATLEQVRMLYLERGDLRSLVELEYDIVGSYVGVACDVAGAGRRRAEALAPDEQEKNFRLKLDRFLTSLDCE